MKILPEHETWFTIMSKLIQVVWITFELPLDEINVSHGGKLSPDQIADKKSTFCANDEEQEHDYDDWNTIALSVGSTQDLSSVLSSSSFQNIHNDDDFAPNDLTVIENMMIERDVPCRATGVMARGVY